MMTNDDLYTVIIDGTAYPADLKALRQWVLENRISPGNLISKGAAPPVAAHSLPELRDVFQPARPVAAVPPPYAPLVPPRTWAQTQAPTSGFVAQPFPVNLHRGPFPNEAHRQDPRYRRAMGHIRRASITGLILSGLMFLLTVWLSYFARVPGGGTLPINPVHVLAVISVLSLALNLGLNFQNRVCAILLFLWVSLTAFGNLFLNFNFLGLVFSVTLSPLYFFAILGTFQYHEFRKDVERGKL